MTVRKLKCVVLAVFASAVGVAFGDIISPTGDAAAATAAIQAAIDAAGTGGTVELGDGTFEIDDELKVSNGITLVGQGWERTTLKQTVSGKRVVTVGEASRLEGVTVTGGKINATWTHGAGVFVDGGTVSFCRITGNGSTATGAGGVGVGLKKGSVDHCVIDNNKSTGASTVGGGVGVDTPTGPVFVDTCLIYGNFAKNGGGIGAVFDNSHQLLTIRNTTIANNTAGDKGCALYGRQNISGTKYDLKLENCVIADNQSESVAGIVIASNQGDESAAKARAGYEAQSSGNVLANGETFGEKSKTVEGSGAGWFADAANGDYHLVSGAAPADGGVWYEGIPPDLDGNVRNSPKTAAGCYEADPAVAVPEFAPQVKRFYPSVDVTLTCSTAGATIYYTVDGSNPTESGVVYERPIVLSGTTTIKAYAAKEGLKASSVVEATYTNPGPPRPGRLGVFHLMATFTVIETVAGTEDGMPVLVKLSEGNPVGFRYADCDPAEMRFGDADFNALPFEVDTWNPEGESLVWVKAPLVEGTEINLVYNGTAADANHPEEVWGDYAGVWHFETLNTSVKVANSQGTYANSTAVAGIDGNVSTYSIAGETGRFGNCFRVNDSTGKQIGNYNKGGVWVNDVGTDSPVDGGANFTISGWFKHGNYDYHYDHFFYKRSASGNGGSPNNAFAIESDSTNGDVKPKPRGSSGTGGQVGLSGNMKDSWSYLTFAFDGTKCHVYENGAFKGDSGITACVDNDCPLIFGDNSAVTTGGGDAAWNGWIDEVRFAKGTKDAAFIAAEYAAMNASDAGVLDYGEVQDVEPDATVANPKIAPENGTAFYPTTNVTMTCLTDGATIRYTTDGTDPTESSEPYEGAIVLSETTTVKARGFKEGSEASDVVSATFVLAEPVPPELGAVTVKPRKTKATISGTVVSVGNLYATACDVYLAIGTSEDDFGAAEKIATGVTDAFKYRISGLEGSTTYYYALSISNNAVFATGAETRGSFTTLESDVIEPEETPAETRQTIQEAIDDAAEEELGGTVTLAEGLFEIDEQIVLEGGVTLVGQGWTNTIIKQTSVGGVFRCVTISGGSTLVGVTLTGGAISAQWEHGAGAFVEDGTISWCCISNNATARPSGNNNYGGGIGIKKGAIDHSIIAYNTSAANGGSSHGGGIGVFQPTGPIVIDTCLVFGNKAPNGGGGGIYASMGSSQSLTVRNTTIVCNSASETGGAYVSAGAGNFVLDNSILADNTSGRGDVNLTLSADNIASQCFGNVFANGTAALGEGSASYPGSGEEWFFDEANGDCHLHVLSPASDSGVWYDGIVDDLDGIVRKEEKMASGCYECTEVDHGVIKLSPIDVTTTTTSATASGSILSLGEGTSATVTLRVGPSFEEMEVADTATGIKTDFELTASGLTHATHYVYEITVENDADRTATASGEFFTQYDPSIALKPSDDPAANVANLSVAFAAAAQTQETVTLDEGVFTLNAPLTVDGGITVVGQGWNKTTLKQVGAGRVMTLAGGSTLRGVTLTGGTIDVAWMHGAGALVENGTISWCCVSNNATARVSGNNNYAAGVFVSKGTVDHSIIAYNTAAAKNGSSYGGGIGMYRPTGPVFIDTCLVYGNKAPNGEGGGVYVYDGQRQVTVRNTTITENSANTQGGGISLSATQLTLQNSIVWNNTASESGEVSGTLAESSAGNLIGEDPKFKDAANGDYRLFYGSPANGIGQRFEGITVDLDGRKRGRRPEAGCYEIYSGLMLMVK